MKDKVERLAKGIFEYEQPEMVLSEEMISVKVPAGRAFCGKFSFHNRDFSVMKGVLYSSNELLVLHETQFIGKENEIEYTIHGEYAIPGEVHRGEITIVSECKEIVLPFVFEVTQIGCPSSEGEIKDLFQFAGLAQSDWYEARTVFMSEHFEKIVLADKTAEQTIYRQLTGGASFDVAMEEFLIYNKKKNPIQIRTEVASVHFEPGEKAVMECIPVYKDIWGYAEISVVTEGDFFVVSARSLQPENFNGNRYMLEVAVDGSTLAEGNYFGRIILKTSRQEIAIKVTCRCVKTVRQEEQKRHSFRLTEGKLLQRYFDFRMRKIKPGSYIAEAESMVDLLLVKLQEEVFSQKAQYKKELAYRMYRAYLALIGGKEKFAAEEISRFKEELAKGMGDAELLGALYYLEAMRQKTAEDVKEYALKIAALSERYEESGILLWFRLYTDKRSEGSRNVHLEELVSCYEKGNRSPVLYYETALIWNEEPSLLRDLGEYELQVLHFALKAGILKREAVLQFSILALQSKQKNPLLCRCLCMAYRQYGQRDVLTALCTLLIHNDRRDKKYHTYFAQACSAQLRIPGVQEYYLYTFDWNKQAQLDQSVLLYFVYGNELEEPYASYLYAYVVKNKNNLSSFYKTYLKRIEQYALENIRKGEIDETLALIYKEVLPGLSLDGEALEQLPKLVFSYCVSCKNKNMVAVSVLHKEESRECIVSFFNGAATVQLYTEEAQLVLLDAEGNRYLTREECSVKPLLPEEEWLSRCYEEARENRMLLLNYLEKVHNYRSVNADWVELSKSVVLLDGLREEFRQAEIYALIRNCYDNFQGDLMDGYLSKLNLDYLTKDERTQMIELLIVRSRYDLALDAITKYGTEQISVKRILRLCERMLLQCGDEQNDMLLRLCCNVFFGGRHNEEIIQYLSRFFNGTTEEMYLVWNAAQELELETEALEERLLGQILFSESYVPEAHKVFLSYVKKRGNVKLIKAYLSCTAFRYFTRDCEVPEEVFELIRNEAEEDNSVCCLAMLKRYAEQEELTPLQVQYAESGMRLFAEKGMIFPFFTQFEGKASLPPCMADKLYVEYRTNPERKVSISYLYDNEDSGRFVCEEMTHVGYGVFVKEFILFYGEVLQYYITEEKDGNRIITESFYRKIDEVKVHDETTKYGQINLILTAQDMKDEKTAMDMLENYFRMEYTMNRLFEPIKE